MRLSCRHLRTTGGPSVLLRNCAAEDDLEVIAGKRDQLLGRIQQRHGFAKEEAEQQVRSFECRNRDVKFEKS